MGAANALHTRPRHATRRAIFETAGHMLTRTEGKVTEDFEILFLSGWAAHDSLYKFRLK